MGRKKGPNLGKIITNAFRAMDRMAKAAAAAEKRRIREQNQRIKEEMREQNQRIREENKRINAINRLAAFNERETLRRIKQEEMAQRRAEREREKAMRDEEKARIREENERVKAEKIQAKLQKEQQLEYEINEIESENYRWTNVHRLIDDIENLEDTNSAIETCIAEQQDYDAINCFFDKSKPSIYGAESMAQTEAQRMFDIATAQTEYQNAFDTFNNFQNFSIPEPSTDIEDFNIPEPTKRDAFNMLTKEAESKISAFFPWKQKRLRSEYVSERLNDFFDNIHDEWEKKKNEYAEHKEQIHKDWERKKNEYETHKSKLLDDLQSKRKTYESLQNDKNEYVKRRTNEVLESQVEKWKNERDEYYTNLLGSLRDMVDGDKDYIIASVNDLFPNDDLPMEYFVDIAYDETTGKALVDLDLPEIEDVPQQKIAVTPSGKKTIRQKTQTDLRSDYVKCIFGLAMYVAYNIFNVSLKIREIEISAYTQRKGDNSALATDQYVLLVDFGRDVFSAIDFQKHSSLEIMEAFKHHYNMTKTYELKEIDLSVAYGKMETFTPAELIDFM